MEQRCQKAEENSQPTSRQKVAMEALAERLTLSELAAKHGLHPNQISTWKKELQANASELFEKQRGPKKVVDEEKEARLFQQIGQSNTFIVAKKKV